MYFAKFLFALGFVAGISLADEHGHKHSNLHRISNATELRSVSYNYTRIPPYNETWLQHTIQNFTDVYHNMQQNLTSELHDLIFNYTTSHRGRENIAELHNIVNDYEAAAHGLNQTDTSPDHRHGLFNHTQEHSRYKRSNSTVWHSHQKRDVVGLYFCVGSNWGFPCYHSLTQPGKCTKPPLLYRKRIGSFGPDQGTRCNFWTNDACNGDHLYNVYWPGYGLPDIYAGDDWSSKIASYACWKS